MCVLAGDCFGIPLLANVCHMRPAPLGITVSADDMQLFGLVSCTLLTCCVLTLTAGTGCGWHASCQSCSSCCPRRFCSSSCLCQSYSSSCKPVCSKKAQERSHASRLGQPLRLSLPGESMTVIMQITCYMYMSSVMQTCTVSSG